MVETRRPPVPAPAERAKTIASRHCPALLMPSAQHGEQPPAHGTKVRPVLQHVHSSGSVSVLLPEKHELVAAAADADGAGLAVMLELTDNAPVELREPVRGLLWITGWLRPLSPVTARARALAIADTRPDPRLLDVGHGLSVLRLSPASLVLADAEGTHALRPHAFRAATPDPFHNCEAGWLRHLEQGHPDVVDQLARHLPEQLREGSVRPLGLDRHGLRLRVEQEAGDHDVRLAFARPALCPAQLGVEMRRLLGCPFHAVHQPR